MKKKDKILNGLYFISFMQLIILLTILLLANKSNAQIDTTSFNGFNYKTLKK